MPRTAAADPRVPNLRVCKHPVMEEAHAGGEGRIYVLSWYRPVGVAKTSSETHGGKTGLPAKGKWPQRGTVTTVLTYPGSAPR